ncbi:hypothetical protein K458DRAFT_431271, partial [Lentithecium fluviatile CBS 122367]
VDKRVSNTSQNHYQLSGLCTPTSTYNCSHAHPAPIPPELQAPTAHRRLPRLLQPWHADRDR